MSAWTEAVTEIRPVAAVIYVLPLYDDVFSGGSTIKNPCGYIRALVRKVKPAS